MSDTIYVEKIGNDEYRLHLLEIGGVKYGMIVETIHESINNQFSEELNDDLMGFLDDDSCEGCKI